MTKTNPYILKTIPSSEKRTFDRWMIRIFEQTTLAERQKIDKIELLISLKSGLYKKANSIIIKI